MLKKLKGLLRRDPEQFRIPRSVQEVIPIRTVWKSGIFLVGSNRYSRTWQFSDINPHGGAAAFRDSAPVFKQLTCQIKG
jgi:hypothetical protein